MIKYALNAHHMLYDLNTEIKIITKIKTIEKNIKIMTETIEKQNPPHYLYSVEFLRIALLSLIIIGHIGEIFPYINRTLLKSLGTSVFKGWFGVEYFFVIGGFFLYNKIQKADNAFTLIKKIYARLLPALLFIFLLCVVFTGSKIHQLPSILALTTGLSIPSVTIGWGDWYVGVYFWSSCLLIGLFMTCKKQAFLLLYIIMYILICFSFNAPYLGWMKTYYTFIGNQFVRGISSMGIGMTAAFIASQLSLKKEPITKTLYSVVEILCIIFTFSYLIFPGSIPFTSLEIQIIFGILIISFNSSYGYLSTILNNMSYIQYISRYTYSIFLAHIIPIRLLDSLSQKNMSEFKVFFIVFGTAIAIGILEYHLIEKKLVPWLKKCLIK